MHDYLKAFGRQIFVLGLLLAPISAFMFFLANNSVKRHAEFDHEPEIVTLRSFAAGDYANRRWFRLTDFCSLASNATGIGQLVDNESTLLVPLWPGQRTDGPAPVVARIETKDSQLSVANVYDWFRHQRALDVQYWTLGDSRIDQLQKIAPNVWHRGARLVEVNADPPTLARAWSFRLWGVLWAILSAICFGYTALFTFGGSGKPKRNTKEPVLNPVPPAAAIPMTAATKFLATEFTDLGYEPAGMFRRNKGLKSTNHHLYVSADERTVLDIVETKTFSRVYLFGVCSDATLLALGSGAKGVDINGTQFNIPIQGYFVVDASPEALVSGFHRLHEQLFDSNPLVRIPTNQAEHVRCYYDRLIEWWMFVSGVTHQSTPGPVPSAGELVQYTEGTASFSWQPIDHQMDLAISQ